MYLQFLDLKKSFNWLHNEHEKSFSISTKRLDVFFFIDKKNFLLSSIKMEQSQDQKLLDFDQVQQNFGEKYDVTKMTERKLILYYEGFGHFWNPSNSGNHKVSKSLPDFATRLCKWKHQLCHWNSSQILWQRLKVKSMRLKVFQEIDS